MPNLDLTFTFTPALVLTAIVFDAGLVMLGIAIVRHMRDQRRPGGSESRATSVTTR
jgi:multisubunit Na+/H+ antiporter MnhC subunit